MQTKSFLLLTTQVNYLDKIYNEIAP